MIAQMTVVSLLFFAVIYPLFHLFNYDTPFVKSFHQFNLGMCGVLGGAGVFLLFLGEAPRMARLCAVPWLVVLLGVTALVWERERAGQWTMSIPSFAGLPLLFYLRPVSPLEFAALTVGALVLSGAVFTTAFGHWYLNVRALSPKYLVKATSIFGGLLLLRLAWDGGALGFGSVAVLGERVPVWRFLLSFEGFFLGVAIFFGTLFPALLLVLAKKTLDHSSTTSATGILYVALISVLMGDFSYKYFTFKYGLGL